MPSDTLWAPRTARRVSRERTAFSPRALQAARWAPAGATLLVHLAVALTSAYGLHRDEYLYLALGQHLDWGFLEVPPGIALVAALLDATVGTSLLAVRMVPALVSAAVVYVTGRLARAMGGGAFAVLLAGLAAAVAPVYLRAGTLFQPVVFDQLAWAVAALCVARRVQTDDARWWLGVGAALGLGLVFKYSALLFGAALVVGVLLTPWRRDLATRWPWLGAAAALGLAAPNLWWQVANGWPLRQHLSALSESQLVHVAPLDFVVEQVLIMHVAALPIWLVGLGLLFTRRGRSYRLLGWSYLFSFGLLLALQGKPYYLAPAYPMLLGSGAVALERLSGRWRPAITRSVAAGVLAMCGLVLLPMGVPVLPPPAMSSYLEALGQTPESEVGQPMRLPQDYADMLGWPAVVEATAALYHSLDAEDRARVVFFGASYGHAGALDYHGTARGLPPAIAASSSYHLWGPGERAADPILFVGLEVDEIAHYYDTCTTQTRVRHPWAREADEPLVLCRGPKQPLATLWPRWSPW